MLGGETRLVALLGDPVAGSLSPRMQNAAFAARGLDWAYVACRVAAGASSTAAVRGLAALGFAGANVTIPHKAAAARSPTTRRRGRAERLGQHARLPRRAHRGLEHRPRDRRRRSRPARRARARDRRRRRGAGARVALRDAARPRCASLHARAATGRRTAPARPARQRDAARDELLVEPRAGQAVVDLAYRADGRRPRSSRPRARPAARRSSTAWRCSSARAPPSFERWTGVAAPLDVMRAAVRAP